MNLIASFLPLLESLAALQNMSETSEYPYGLFPRVLAFVRKLTLAIDRSTSVVDINDYAEIAERFSLEQRLPVEMCTSVDCSKPQLQSLRRLGNSTFGVT